MRQPSSRSPTRAPHIAIRIGHWFEAQATGWAVVIVPIVLFGLLFALHVLRS